MRFPGGGVLRALLLVSALTVSILVAVTPVADAQPGGRITSAGPLTVIGATPDLNCSVSYQGDTNPEFFGTTACGTLVAVGGTLYGPNSIPAGGSASPRTAFRPVSQAGPTGSGRAADPYRLVTVVDLGTTGIRLTQTDTYVVGTQSYTSVVSLANRSANGVAATVYRAADCYLANSDFGTGQTGSQNSVACSSGNGRVEAWVPITPGSHFYEAGYDEVWRRIGQQLPFPDTCRCGENIDNGAGLSWSVQVPAGGGTVVAHRTAFSPVDDQQVDRDGDGLLDDWETSGIDTNGDGTIDVDLRAMGASPDHKDLFVEVDHMVRPPTCVWFVCWGGRSFAPDQDAVRDVVRAFAAAPVGNPDRVPGVRLHADSGPNSVMNPVTGATWGARSRSNLVAYSRALGTIVGDDYRWGDFNSLKSANFDPARADVFHYALDLDTFAGSDFSGIAQGLPGDSFIVAKGAFNSGPSRRQESGTFMHEFGHTLGLHHGGGSPDPGLDVNYKPNYLSIMSYAWQFDGRTVDYSRSSLPVLDERALSESAGLRGTSENIRWYCGNRARERKERAAGANIDWNCNGRIDAGTLPPTNINVDDPAATFDVLNGHDDWPNLTYDGGAVGAFGANDLDDQNPPPTETPVDEATLTEIRTVQPLAGPGDGTMAVVGPTVLAVNAPGQRLHLDVTNIGPTDAQYTVTVSGLPAAAAPQTVPIAAGATVRVLVPVDATRLRPGRLSITGTVTAPGSAEPLHTDTLEVTVVDPSDPAVQAAARTARDQLNGPRPGLDERVRADVIAVLNTIVTPTPPPTTTPNPTPTSCNGAVPTISSNAPTVNGTPGDDVIVGGPANQRFFGGGGRDLICGGDGNDVLNGGDGDDYLDGQGGQDIVIGNVGSDVEHGGDLRDKVGGTANDPGQDQLFGDAGAPDQCFGAADADRFDPSCESRG